MTTAWWKDKNVQLYDNSYSLAEERKKELCEKCKVIGILFGSLQNRSTQHFIKYLEKLYSVSAISQHNYSDKTFNYWPYIFQYTKEEQAKFEIVHVPLDESEADCSLFVKGFMGNWLVLPWQNENLRT
jgi:hypothetical protein